MAEHGLDGPGAGVRLGRHRLRQRRHDLGRRGAGVPGGELRPRRPTCGPSPCPAAIAAMREPRRSALGLLYEILGDAAAGQSPATADWFSPAELETLLAALGRSVNCPRTSSMGRLFDAVAALCGLPPVISFEGQAAMALEFAADEESTGLSVAAGRGRARRGRLGAAGAGRAGRSRGRRARRPDQRPLPQRPGRAGRGGGAAGGRAAGGAQRRLFPKRPVDRARPPPAVGGRLFRVHSPASPARRRRHRPGPSLRRRRTPSTKDHPMCLGIPGKVLEIYHAERPAHGQGRVRRHRQGNLPGLHARGPGGRLT